MKGFSFSTPKTKKPENPSANVDEFSYTTGSLQTEEIKEMTDTTKEHDTADLIKVDNLADLDTVKEEKKNDIVEGPFASIEDFPTVGKVGIFYSLMDKTSFAWDGSEYKLVMTPAKAGKVEMIKSERDLIPLSESDTVERGIRYVTPDGTIFKYSAYHAEKEATRTFSGKERAFHYIEVDMMDEPDLMKGVIESMKEQIAAISEVEPVKQKAKKSVPKLAEARAKRKKAKKKAMASRKRNRK